MTAFICYSHEDEEFVDRLVIELLNKNFRLYFDKWEIRVGDSIMDKVQSGLKFSSAIIIVLSKSSTNSAWVKHELNAGLHREIKEKKSMLLPIIIEDCETPVFLEDKLYADFRVDYDVGLNELIVGLEKIESDRAGSLESHNFYTDWALNWFVDNGKLIMEMLFVQPYYDQQFTIVTEIQIEANKTATRRFLTYEKEGIGWFGRQVLLGILTEEFGKFPHIKISDNIPQKGKFGIRDKNNTGIYFGIKLKTWWVGPPTGNDLVVHIHDMLKEFIAHLRETSRELSTSEKLRLAQVLGTPIA